MKLNFNNREKVLKLSQECQLFAEAEVLKQLIQDRKEIRDPFYLELSELDEILKFKLRTQYNRQKAARMLNEEQIIRRITQIALNIHAKDSRYEDELRVNILCVLKGINIPTASAILALTDPRKYAIIDRRNWRYLNPDSKKTNFTINDYLNYLDVIREKAEQLDLDAQIIDMAIWQDEFSRSK